MLQIDTENDVFFAKITGALTIYEVAEYQLKLQQLDLDNCQVMVDLAGVDEIDTAGLQLLMVLRKSLGERLRMQNHSPSVIELLDIYHLATFFGDHIILSGH